LKCVCRGSVATMVEVKEDRTLHFLCCQLSQADASRRMLNPHTNHNLFSHECDRPCRHDKQLPRYQPSLMKFRMLTVGCLRHHVIFYDPRFSFLAFVALRVRVRVRSDGCVVGGAVITSLYPRRLNSPTATGSLAGAFCQKLSLSHTLFPFPFLFPFGRTVAYDGRLRHGCLRSLQAWR
jgi:hypothetical protein